MSDISKLPKWAQIEIEELRANQHTKNTGVNISESHFENVGIKHTPETVTAICSISDAFTAHAEALKELAKSVSGGSESPSLDCMVRLPDINTPK